MMVPTEPVIILQQGATTFGIQNQFFTRRNFLLPFRPSVDDPKLWYSFFSPFGISKAEKCHETPKISIEAWDSEIHTSDKTKRYFSGLELDFPLMRRQWYQRPCSTWWCKNLSFNFVFMQRRRTSKENCNGMRGLDIENLRYTKND